MRLLFCLLLLSCSSPAAADKLRARHHHVTPVITADAYAQGDQIGALTRLQGIRGCSGCPIKIEALTIIDKDKAKDAFDIYLFTAEVTPAADNAAVSFSDSDMATSFAGRIALAAADYTDNAANSAATLKPALLVPGGAGTTDLWMALVCTDAGGCDWTAVTDLTLRFTYLE